MDLHIYDVLHRFCKLRVAYPLINYKTVPCF